jgi:oxaloacetate decarboxylase beta subunit
MGEFFNFIGNNLADFWGYTGFANATLGHFIMILVGCVFIYLAVRHEFEPMLLIPIGFGMLVGNIPFNMDAGLQLGIYEQNSVLNTLYQGVTSGWYPPLIFLGIGAMTDFSALISNPKLMLVGAAAQFGIFGAYMLALLFGFTPMEAGAIGIIGGADGPTAIFLSSKLAPNLMGAIAVSAYSYMALVPVIQPPIMRLLTTKKERVMRMKPPRPVSHTEKVMFPIIGLLLTCFFVPSGLPLLGMLFFGNLLKESGVTRRLAETARNQLIDVITMLLGLTVGASTQASEFLTMNSVFIFMLGALSFVIATTSGILFVKLFNLVLPKEKKLNPLIGNAGVSAVPDSARISQVVGLEYDPTNYLLMHAMGPNVAGVIGSAVAAGILLGFLI